MYDVNFSLLRGNGKKETTSMKAGTMEEARKHMLNIVLNTATDDLKKELKRAIPEMEKTGRCVTAKAGFEEADIRPCSCDWWYYENGNGVGISLNIKKAS